MVTRARVPLRGDPAGLTCPHGLPQFWHMPTSISGDGCSKGSVSKIVEQKSKRKQSERLKVDARLAISQEGEKAMSSVLIAEKT